MLRTHRAGKGPGGWGGGLRLREQKGPRCAPHPWSQMAGALTWEPSKLSGPEWAGQLPSAPLLLLLEGPSPLPLLNSPQPPSYAPRTNVAGKWRGLWRAGDWPGSSAGSQGPSGWGKCPPLLPEGPSCLPLPTSPELLKKIEMAKKSATDEGAR